jgi:hypothetical protein
MMVTVGVVGITMSAWVITNRRSETFRERARHHAEEMFAIEEEPEKVPGAGKGSKPEKVPGTVTSRSQRHAGKPDLQALLPCRGHRCPGAHRCPHSRSGHLWEGWASMGRQPPRCTHAAGLARRVGLEAGRRTASRAGRGPGADLQTPGSPMHQPMHQIGFIGRHSESTDVNAEGSGACEKAAS